MKCTPGFEQKCKDASPSGACSCACGGYNHGRSYDEPEYDDDVPAGIMLDEQYIQGHAKTRRVWIGSTELTPKESWKLFEHSLDGFSWGYGGSGPAQLALAIMLKFTDKKNASNLHQDFKWEILAKLPKNENFILPIDGVEDWVDEREK